MSARTKWILVSVGLVLSFLVAFLAHQQLYSEPKPLILIESVPETPPPPLTKEEKEILYLTEAIKNEAIMQKEVFRIYQVESGSWWIDEKHDLNEKGRVVLVTSDFKSWRNIAIAVASTPNKEAIVKVAYSH